MSGRLRSWMVGAAVAALLTAANGSQGGYFSQSWGWIALTFVAAVSLALILGVAGSPGRLRLAFAALVAALGVWVTISVVWSFTPSGSLREAERVLVYVAAAGAIALVLRRRDAFALAGGVFAGGVAICGYALATRLFQDSFGSFDDPTSAYRLSTPLGYWNALGLLASMTVLLGVGLVAHGRRWPTVAAAGATLPVVAATMYFTFSRGAWAALGVGVIAMVALDARRVRLLWSLLVVAPASAVAIAVGSRYEALTTEGSARDEAVSQGHRFAVVIGALVVVSSLLALAARWGSRRIPAPHWAGRAVNVGLVGSAALAFVVVVVLAGGPRDAFAEIENRFEAEPADEPGNLNDRLLRFSGTWRADIVNVAWDAGNERPVVGHGAGSFEYLWYQNRPLDLEIRDAHSLYAEVFAELGIVGIAFLVTALLVPLVAAVRARRNRLVPAAVAAYIAWLAHAGLDWDWEVVGLTLTALLAGAVALLAAERGVVRRALPETARWPLLAASLVLTVVALVSLVGNQALFAAREAMAREEWREARKHARLAERLLPWSHEPHIVLGDTAAELGDRQGAIDAYRAAVETDRRDWISWLRLGQVTAGAERRAAYERVHELNPRQRDLPGDPDG